MEGEERQGKGHNVGSYGKGSQCGFVTLTQPELSVLVAEAICVVIPATVEINTPVLPPQNDLPRGNGLH